MGEQHLKNMGFNFQFNKSNKKLLLLLLVFIFAIVSQSALNYSFSIANQDLDNKNKQLFTVSILGENIVRKLNDIQSLFYQLVISDSYKHRTIIQKEILEKTKEIELYLNILDNGGSFDNNISANLIDETIMQNYTLQNTNHLKVIGIDIKPKLAAINNQVSKLIILLNTLEDDRISPTKFATSVDKIRQFVKHTSPLFVRTIENANRIYYELIQQKQQLELEIKTQKEDYKIWQITLAISILVFGLFMFSRLGRQMQDNNYELQERKDYVDDILKSQSNIIIVNNGKDIIDISGGFFSLFTKYQTLDEFTKDYDCICDTFVQEKGFLDKYMDDVFWVKYVANNPDKTHKAKIYYENQTYIYTVSCVKSKYGKYIISMFDITQMEDIQTDLSNQKNTAIKAVNSKSEFLANMSHEIRTPLNAILGFITLLKDKKLDNEGKEFLRTIESSGQSLLSIVNDVLDYSKIEENKIILDPIDFDSIFEFKMLANLFNSQCKDKNITLHTHFSENIPKNINADILRIKQIIINLLSNAVKFTKDDKNIFFNISYANDKLSFEVIDEGIGMSEVEQKNVFDKFSQAKSSITREFGGTGLGLAISSKLTKLLGGKLIVKSKEGVGSTFSFTIPIKIAKNNTTHTTINANKQFSGKILLVEDNKTNQMLMSVILKKQGVSFDIAGDGVEGVEAFKKSQYDLILMDNNMPRMSGIEACEIIREYEVENNLQPTAIIALTASTTTSEKEQFTAIGMNDYLSKPLEINKLLEIFNKFLRQS